MKATTIVCLIVLIFGFGIPFVLQAQEIPGGIVYSDGKDAVYYDYKTGQTANLTSDLKGPAIKGPLAASEDGLMLIWVQDGKFTMRRFPDGKPYLATMDKMVTDRVISSHESIGHSVQVPMPAIQKEIRNLMLSPEGTHLACEFTEEGKYWVQTSPPNDPKYPHKGRGSFGGYPEYQPRTGQEFNAIKVIRIGGMLTNDYGNSAFYPPSFPFRGRYEDLGPEHVARARRDRVTEGPLETSRTIPDIRPGLIVPIEETHKKFSIKRDAHFLAWQKASFWQPTQRLVALIYQTEKGWGPIEIRDINPYPFKNIKPPKPGVWEIPVVLSDCKSLAWKPDGSLTYLSERRVFSIDDSKILEGIRNSGVTNYREPGNSIPQLIPTKNVLGIKPELVARGIDGDRLHWVTNDTFLFRGREGSPRNISSWHEGRIERICHAPDEYSYCDQPPIGIFTTTPGVILGKSRVLEEIQGCHFTGGKNAEFFVGSIRTRWAGQNSEKIRIWVGKLESQDSLEYAFPTEANLEDINNPERYSYKRCEWSGIPGGKSSPRVGLELNAVLLLRLGNCYAAIKPLAVEPKYKSVEEMPLDMRKDWVSWNGPPPIYEWMTYEWKYWSQFAKIDSNAKNKNELADKSLAPTMSKDTAVGKPNISREGNPLEFSITAGDIKIVCRKTVWGKAFPENKDVIGIGFNVNPQMNGGNAGYTSIGENGILLESIIDPSKYNYRKPQTLTGHTIQLGWIFLLKVGDKYVAVKPIEITKQGAKETLVYEWKYWPGASPETSSIIGTPPSLATAK